MSFTPSSPVTGGVVPTATSPTFTLTADADPAPQAKQYFVSTLGGTQTGVTVHTVASPFTIAFWKPVALVAAQFFSALTGFKTRNPTNRYKLVVRKGVTPASGAVAQEMTINVSIDCPAGAESFDAANVNAALSLFAGAFMAQCSGISDNVKFGTK